MGRQHSQSNERPVFETGNNYRANKTARFQSAKISRLQKPAIHLSLFVLLSSFNPWVWNKTLSQ
jgi:hypothetical protein